jgi:hypothetical protein
MTDPFEEHGFGRNQGADVHNDGRWPEAHAVEVRYPLTEWQSPEGVSDDEAHRLMKADRERWPWLGGEIKGQCGPAEWEVVVYDERLAQLEDGSPAPAGTPGEDLLFPTCYRDGSEIREPQREAEPSAEAPGEISPEAVLARLDAELEAGQ